ncbi:MAG: phenylalanine--tRNA ligase subunit beta [Candidatus Omnitrophota bacterium]
MRFSLNFIKEILEVPIPASDLVSLLSLSGMEVEHFEKVEEDWVFDIEVTSNRYDWLSMLGIAREMAACLNKTLTITYPALCKKPVYNDKRIHIENSKDCLFYVGRLIRGVQVEKSPAWLAERVTHCGVSAINNVVDITNYCMLKWGNPLHAFDADKIEGDIFIRRAKKEETFVGIDEKERTLGEENLVIADAKKIIALAGVMGAKNTEVGPTTKNIFLEAAIFSPLTIRHSRRAVGLDTESSYRFERQVFSDYMEYASMEAQCHIEKYCHGMFAGYQEAGKKPVVAAKKITFQYQHLNNYLGTIFPRQKIKTILSHLGCVVKQSGGRITVLVPKFRFDLKREVDVYEELSRIYGYDKIAAQIPFLPPVVKKDEPYEFKKQLKAKLSSLGLKEIITYSVESQEESEVLVNGPMITILNPLRQQENALRISLLLGMLKAITYNVNRSREGIRFFEIADVYMKEKSGFREKPFVSIGLAGPAYDFFYLKGIVAEMMKCLDIATYELKEESTPHFTNALSFFVGGVAAGFLGKLDAQTKKKFDIQQNVLFAQLDLNILRQHASLKAYTHFSAYPAIWRDISIALRKDKAFKDVEAIIRADNRLVCGWRVVDIYKGKDVALDHTAFTLRMFYQSQEKTLTSQEVDTVHNAIRENLRLQDGIVLR